MAEKRILNKHINGLKHHSIVEIPNKIPQALMLFPAFSETVVLLIKFRFPSVAINELKTENTNEATI